MILCFSNNQVVNVVGFFPWLVLYVECQCLKMGSVSKVRPVKLFSVVGGVRGFAEIKY